MLGRASISPISHEIHPARLLRRNDEKPGRVRKMPEMHGGQRSLDGTGLRPISPFYWEDTGKMAGMAQLSGPVPRYSRRLFKATPLGGLSPPRTSQQQTRQRIGASKGAGCRSGELTAVMHLGNRRPKNPAEPESDGCCRSSDAVLWRGFAPPPA